MSLRFPSKTFILGEYAILETGEALLLGHGPWFEAEYGGATHSFHPSSPAGQWLSTLPSSLALRFTDPHRGAGGFGGSGAEFLSAWSFERKIPSSWRERQAFAWAAWDDSRKFPGSGADILTQAWGVNYGKDFWLGIDTKNRALEPLDSNFGLRLSLFSTGKKLATHTHLQELPPLPLEELWGHVIDGKEALRARSSTLFAAAMNGYGQCLAERGLLAEHSARALGALPQRKVLASKGCGAMGADVLAVLHDGAELENWARENSLAEVRTLPV